MNPSVLLIILGIFLFAGVVVVLLIARKSKENYQESCDLQPGDVMWKRIGEKACKSLMTSCDYDPGVDCNAFQSDKVVNDRAIQQRALVFAQMGENAGNDETFVAKALANTMESLSYVFDDINELRREIQALKDQK